MKKKRLGYTPEQIAAGTKARNSASQSTPVAVVNAFFPECVLAGDLPLLPVTMSVVIALQKVGCKLLLSGDAKDLDMESIAQALYVMTTPIAEVRSRIGSGTFASAVDVLADSIPASLLAPVGQLLNKHLTDAFATAIPFGPDKSDPSSPFPAARTQGPGSAGSQP